jgi:hypothetical protein
VLRARAQLQPRSHIRDVRRGHGRTTEFICANERHEQVARGTTCGPVFLPATSPTINAGALVATDRARGVNSAEKLDQMLGSPRVYSGSRASTTRHHGCVGRPSASRTASGALPPGDRPVTI